MIQQFTFYIRFFFFHFFFIYSTIRHMTQTYMYIITFEISISKRHRESANSSKHHNFAFFFLICHLQTLTDNKTATSKKSSSAANNDRDEMWHRMLALAPKNSFYMPDSAYGHRVLTIEPANIVEITKTALKIDTDAILNNWTQRQMPRFRDAPIGPTTEKVLTELYNLHQAIKSKKQKLQFVNFKTELKMIQELDLIHLYRKKVDAALAFTKNANFEQEFAPVFDRKQLEAKQAELKFKMSNQNLALYPEYQYKLEILKRLNYIDDQHAVTLKGRVACEMGSNELMITELVLCNTFNDLGPAEIAALLSSLVFQGKTQTELKLTDNLKAVSLYDGRDIQIVHDNFNEIIFFFVLIGLQCVETIKSVDRELRETEDDVMKNVDREVRETAQSLEEDRLNFGLVQVVYEWARDKVNS